jgi:hypothetical protein
LFKVIIKKLNEIRVKKDFLLHLWFANSEFAIFFSAKMLVDKIVQNGKPLMTKI